MRTTTAFIALSLVTALCSSAAAQFSESGAGAPFPGAGAADGSFPSSLPTPVTTSVVVSVPVNQIDAITIEGLRHDWMGDMQVGLRDPSGVEHLVFVRPGFQNSSVYGNSGQFTTGDYRFVESGAPNSLPTNDAPVYLTGGDFNQSFHTGGAAWTSGTAGIHNTPLGAISGPAGIWTLVIYDWYVGADDGFFTGWTLDGNGNGGGAFCFGDGSSKICPCGNMGGAGAGCGNSTGLGGLLSASGAASIATDDLVLRVQQCPPNKLGVFFQGDLLTAGGQGALFGDGLRCAGGSIVRLEYGATNGGGGVASTVSIANRGGVSASDVRYYQFWYRDIQASPCNQGFNLTNALEILWN